MKLRLAVCVMALSSLSACELLNKYKIMEVEQEPSDVQELTDIPKADQFCVVQDADPLPEHNCDLSYWLTFWMDNNNRPWVQRKVDIGKLSKSHFDQFKKILLSQGKGTPFQDRLRAQSWADELLPVLSPWMQNFLKVLVYQPSQELLEFESALAILTRVNTNQSTEIEEQQKQLLEQQQQIEQFLKIEASMMEKREGINQ